MRVPNPPARITHCMVRSIWTLSVPRQQRGAFVIEGEADFAQTFLLHGPTQSLAVLGEEQQEAAAAGADELASDGSVVAADLVPAVNAFVAGSGRALLLVQPVLMHQLAEAAGVALLQRVLDAVPKLLDKMEIIEHGGVADLGANFLIVEHRRRVAGVA